MPDTREDEQFRDGLQTRFRVLQASVRRHLLDELELDLRTDVRIKEMRLLESLARLRGWDKRGAE